MFLETYKAEGLAALSYVIGDGGAAAVIDPQRDCERYIELAHRNGARITHIIETHRNEDYVVGSCELAARTGATIYHGANLDFAYGEDARDGDALALSDNLTLKILETPGHTDESLSVAIYDAEFSDAQAVGVFTGDALFVGDVGRTDFYPERREEVAGLLYDSIHAKLLPLGDGVILYPAHGAGSVCGGGMASREFSTLGYERRTNPRLQLSRDAFIRAKVDENHYQPPYFREVEDANRSGRRFEALPAPKPLSAEAFAAAQEDDGMIVVDLRSAEAICGAHVPGSLGIPLSMLAAFAGWYLPFDRPIGLVVEDFGQVEDAVRSLVRLGYERVEAFLADGLHAWETSGRAYRSVPTIHARELKRRLDDDAELTLLDVRAIDEYEEKHLARSTHVYVGELAEKFEEVPRDRPVVTFCGSGQRALVAATVLLRRGFDDVSVCLGSMAACEAIGCAPER